MAGFLSKVKKVPHHLPTGTHGGGHSMGKHLMGVAVDKGERMGGSYLVSMAKGYYGDRFMWRGHGLDLWGGAVGMLLTAGLSAYGHHGLASHLERASDVLLQSWVSSYGAQKGAQMAGRVVQVLNPGKTAVRGLPRTSVGAIPPAKSGVYIDDKEIARWASRRAA